MTKWTRGNPKCSSTLSSEGVWALRSQEVQAIFRRYSGCSPANWLRFYPPLCHSLASNWPQSHFQSLLASISASVYEDLFRALMSRRAQLSDSAVVTALQGSTRYLLSTEASQRAVWWCLAGWINPTIRECSTGYHWSKRATGVYTWTGKRLPLRVSPRDSPHLYMDTLTSRFSDTLSDKHIHHPQWHRQTHRHKETHKQTHINIHRDTYKHA